MVLVAALSQVVTPNALCADPKPRPNIVIIMVDDKCEWPGSVAAEQAKMRGKMV